MNSKLFFYLSSIETNYVRYMKHLDSQISKNLYSSGAELRPAKSCGLWCCCLLPIILTFYSWLYKVPQFYKIVSYLSIGLLFYSILFIIFISVSDFVLKEPVYGGCVASSLISTLLLYIFLNQDLPSSIILAFSAVFLNSILLRFAITRFPKTFTVGEIMIVSQAFILFGIGLICKMIYEAKKDLITVVVCIVLSSVAIITISVHFLKQEYRNMRAFSSIMISTSIYALVTLHLFMGVTSTINLIAFVFMNQHRVQLFLFWISLVVAAVLVIMIRTNLAVKATTVTRKSFHVLASLVFMSGILVDVELMRLAAGVGLGLLILMETLRKSNIDPITSYLQAAFDIYSDEKDCGALAMTPVYLYIGLACPLALVPTSHNSNLELLSGVLSIGIGDTGASWFGYRYGTNKWSGSNRTVEGTMFNILSQIATVYGLIMFDLLDEKNALIRATIASTVSALVEAKIEQVDNLVLPLVTLMTFQFTSILC